MSVDLFVLTIGDVFRKPDADGHPTIGRERDADDPTVAVVRRVQRRRPRRPSLRCRATGPALTEGRSTRFGRVSSFVSSTVSLASTC